MWTVQCVNAFIIFPELTLVGLNLNLGKQCKCHLLMGVAVNHLHSVLVAKMISISLRGCVDSVFSFQLWSNCSQLALLLSLCLYFRPWLYVACPPLQLYFTNSNFERVLLSNVTFCQHFWSPPQSHSLWFSVLTFVNFQLCVRHLVGTFYLDHLHLFYVFDPSQTSFASTQTAHSTKINFVHVCPNVSCFVPKPDIVMFFCDYLHIDLWGEKQQQTLLVPVTFYLYASRQTDCARTHRHAHTHLHSVMSCALPVY